MSENGNKDRKNDRPAMDGGLLAAIHGAILAAAFALCFTGFYFAANLLASGAYAGAVAPIEIIDQDGRPMLLALEFRSIDLFRAAGNSFASRLYLLDAGKWKEEAALPGVMSVAERGDGRFELEGDRVVFVSDGSSAEAVVFDEPRPAQMFLRGSTLEVLADRRGNYRHVVVGPDLEVKSDRIVPYPAEFANYYGPAPVFLPAGGKSSIYWTDVDKITAADLGEEGFGEARVLAEGYSNLIGFRGGGSSYFLAFFRHGSEERESGKASRLFRVAPEGLEALGDFEVGIDEIHLPAVIGGELRYYYSDGAPGGFALRGGEWTPIEMSFPEGVMSDNRANRSITRSWLIPVLVLLIACLIAAPLASALISSRHIMANKRGLGAGLGELELASPLRRGLAFLFDICLVMGPFLVMAFLKLGGAIMEEDMIESANTLLQALALSGFSLLVAAIYFPLSEALGSATVGKRVLKLRVVGDDGSDADTIGIIYRNLMRAVDMLPLCLPAVIGMCLSDKLQRPGDRVGKTAVIRDDN